MLADFNLNFPVAPTIAIAFVIIFLLFIFISGMAIYSLLHFGRSRIVGAVVSIIYSSLILMVVINALISLQKL
jgi:hypothetical protein